MPGSTPQRGEKPSSTDAAAGRRVQADVHVKAADSRNRLFVAVGAGVVLAVAGALLHGHVWLAAAVDIPWAAALVVLAVCARCRVMRHEDGDGRRCGVFALAWLAATTLIALVRTNDLVIASDVLGLGYLLVGSLAIGTAASWPSRAERQRWAAMRR